MAKFLITLFLGWAGIHKFMEKKAGMGILYLFTFGLFGIGWLIDILVALTKISSNKVPEPIVSTSFKPKTPSAPAAESPAVTVKVSNINMKNYNKYKECFIAFDLETTGINANKDKIIEISAIIFRNFVPCETFSSLVNPEVPIPSSASKVNHIYDKDVAEAPVEGVCMKDFCNFIGSQGLNGEVALVAHNASFDSKFLSIALNRCCIANNIVYLDTLRFARKAELGVKNNKLGTLADYFGIEQYSAHRAEDDARVCGEIFIKLLQLRKSKTTNTNKRG